MFHKPKLSEIRASAIWLIYPRLIAEASSFSFSLDQLVQKAVNPVFLVMNSLDALIGKATSVGRDAVRTVQTIENTVQKADATRASMAKTKDAAAYLMSKGDCTQLTGVISQDITGGRKPKLDLKMMQAFDALPKAMAVVRGQVNWSIQKTQAKFQKLQKSTLKLIDRRLASGGDRVETLCTLRSLDASLSALQSISVELQRMKSANDYGRQLEQALSTADRSSVFGNVSSALQQGASISASLQLPEPPKTAREALKNGGSKVIGEDPHV
jgi:hypothetical protein